MSKALSEGTQEILENAGKYFIKHYNQGLEHAIEVVKTIWKFDKLQDPNNNPYLKIIIEIQKLKYDEKE